MSIENAVYWSRDPLDSGDIAVLRRIKAGKQRATLDRFSVAYLVARGCVSADYDPLTLTVTEKGDDALEYFAKEEE